MAVAVGYASVREVTIHEDRYAELLKAEHTAEQLRSVLRERCASGYKSLTHDEIKFLCSAVFGAEAVKEWTTE